LLDVASGREVSPLLPHPELDGACFSPDSRWILTWGGTQACLWEANSGRRWATLHGEPAVTCAAFDNASAKVVTGTRIATLWDLQGRKLKEIPVGKEGAYRVGFSQSGDKIVVAGGLGGISLWNTATGQPVCPPQRQRWGMLGTEFSPLKDDDRVLTYSYYGIARIWDGTTGKPLSPSFLNEGPLQSACFSPDGHSLATGCGDGTVRLWWLNHQQPALRRQVPLDTAPDPDSNTTAVYLSPDGSKVVNSRQRASTCQVWDTSSGRPLCAPLAGGKTLILRAKIDAESRLLAVGGVEPEVVEIATGKPVGPKIPRCSSGYLNLALDPSGRRLATLETDNHWRIWDVKTAQPLTPSLPLPSMPVECAFSPDGKRLLMGCADQVVRTFDTSTGQMLTQADQGMFVCALAYSRDGQRMATGCGDGTARVWDAHTGKPISLPMASAAAVVSVAFSADGNRLAVCSADGKARLWDAASGEPLLPSFDVSNVLSAVFTSDGKTLITASAERILSWDVTPPASQSPEVVALRAQVQTGMALQGPGGSALTLVPLSAEQWQERVQRLQSLTSTP
jgi:WD40 repeat protein